MLGFKWYMFTYYIIKRLNQPWDLQGISSPNKEPSVAASLEGHRNIG